MGTLLLEAMGTSPWHGHVWGQVDASYLWACLRVSVLSTEERSCELSHPSQFTFPLAQQLSKPPESPNP